MKIFRILFLTAVFVCAAAAQDTSQELLRHYRALVQINTSSPPGNETAAVEYLKKVLEGEGIPVQIFAQDAKRANLVARLKGNGKKKPLLLMAHTDVVPVQREKWPVDPFGAILKDGYVWGRGSKDDKDKLASNLMVMLRAKRAGVVLDRDLIFLAESGEEADPAGVGIPYMVANHFDEINAEFAITEGGGVTLDTTGNATVVTIGTTEKVPRRVRLIATGVSGHGSVPRLDNSLIHLSAAVAKIGTWETPMRLNETTRTYFEKLAAMSTPAQAARYNGLLGPNPPESIQKYLAANEPSRYSMLRTSVVPTMMKAGVGPNVIPSEAEATIDIRALPDEDMPKFYEVMKQIINDPAVRIEPITGNLRPAGPPSRLDSEMYHALEKVSKQMYPHATVLPTMSTGASDMAQTRAKGIPSYGIGPASSESDSALYGAHGDVERLAESSLYGLEDFTWKVVMEVSAPK
ncbi:MAG TPA: M20/M25/M40 family metallo-hydrolase [Bryobacteraceae bacterium]|jgi:acetylornithine deacetylase/succinyl-diaminopimelate desuccinylase-like protein|nr:M20/M25/M40 family metallo-hydrolase [Bryobacteraceae bacterium]